VIEVDLNILVALVHRSIVEVVEVAFVLLLIHVAAAADERDTCWDVDCRIGLAWCKREGRVYRW
jgi:hypothetical protein